MPLRLHDQDATLAAIRAAKAELFLGIITVDDLVVLRVADRIRIVGHEEWLRLEPSIQAMGGFALLVKEGKVAALYPASRLNPQPDCTLENAIVNELLLLLPRDEGFRVLLG